MEHYSNFCTFEIASLRNVLGHYLRKYSNIKDRRISILQKQRGEITKILGVPLNQEKILNCKNPGILACLIKIVGKMSY